jgi:hypothetical protein
LLLGPARRHHRSRCDTLTAHGKGVGVKMVFGS